MKRLFLFLLFITASFAAIAQKRISLLTCGTGDELYSLFGHAAIRIADTARGTDEVYNYGTFNGFEENFEIKYMRGKLLYYLAKESYPGFLQTYVAEERSVQEQVLNLDSIQEEQLYQALEENLLPQNAAYKYDFLYDNCATRIRDIFPKALWPQYQLGGADSIPYKTFRNSIDDYLAPRPWERFGIDLLLGRPVDAPVSPVTMQYLPDFLRSGIANSRIGGRPFAQPPTVILPGAARSKNVANGPFWLFAGMLALGLVLWLVKPLRNVAELYGRTVLLLTGLLGLLIGFMWLGTDHQACRPNWNLLWMLPTGVVGAFLRGKAFRKYVLFAAVVMALALVLHFMGIQEMPFRTAWPLLLLLLLSHGVINKKMA